MATEQHIGHGNAPRVRARKDATAALLDELRQALDTDPRYAPAATAEEALKAALLGLIAATARLDGVADRERYVDLLGQLHRGESLPAMCGAVAWWLQGAYRKAGL